MSGSGEEQGTRPDGIVRLGGMKPHITTQTPDELRAQAAFEAQLAICRAVAALAEEEETTAVMQENDGPEDGDDEAAADAVSPAAQRPRYGAAAHAKLDAALQKLNPGGNR